MRYHRDEAARIVEERLGTYSQDDLRALAAVGHGTRLGDWVDEWRPLPIWLERETRRLAKQAWDAQDDWGRELLQLGNASEPSDVGEHKLSGVVVFDRSSLAPVNVPR